VLLVGIHLGRQVVQARLPPEPRQLAGPTPSRAARGDSERRHFGASAANFFV